MYNIGLVSLGCAKNQTDAEIMLGILANDGFNITYNPSDADVIISYLKTIICQYTEHNFGK